MSDGAWFEGFDRDKQLGRKRTQICKTIGLGAQDRYRNIERDNVLLKGQVSICRDKHVEVLTSNLQQLAIFESGPAHLPCRLDIMAR